MPKARSLREVLGANVMALRKARGLSQRAVAQIAKRSGMPMDQRTVGRIESGTVPTTLDMIAAIAKALEAEPWQLLVEGIDPQALPGLSLDGMAAHERQMLEKYRDASPRWRMALQHLAALRSDQQEEVSEGTMVLLAKAAADPAPDHRVETAYGAAPSLQEPPQRDYRKKIGIYIHDSR